MNLRRGRIYSFIPKPGSDLVLLNAITKYILDQGWVTADSFIEQRVNGFKDYVASLGTYTLDYAEKITGVRKGNIDPISRR